MRSPSRYGVNFDDEKIGADEFDGNESGRWKF